MSNSISWMGNRVIDPNTPRQVQQPAAAVSPAQQESPIMPQTPMQQTPIQQGGFAMPETRQGPPPATEKGYIPNYLASNIGKSVRAEFIIGTSQYADKTGILSEVGINYFVLHDVNSRTDTMCDLYSVKFVTVLLQ